MYDQIFNILSDTYGRGAMVEGLAEQVQKLLEKDGLTDKTGCPVATQQPTWLIVSSPWRRLISFSIG